MRSLAAPRTVKQAVRMIKHMNVQGPEWAGIHEERLEATWKLGRGRRGGPPGRRTLHARGRASRTVPTA